MMSDADSPMMIANLSVCMIAHNEEGNLPRALASVRGWTDQIIVLDCGSSDRTSDVARDNGASVFHAKNNLPELSKNRSFEYADREWIFIVDADEEIPKQLWDEIATLIARNPRENGFKIPRRNFYLGSPVMHGGNYPDRQLRLFRRGRGVYPTGVFHERLRIDGDVGELTNAFDHHPYPSFSEWMRKLDYYTNYGASKLAEANVPINASTIRHHMVTRPLRRWVERLVVKRGMRDGVAGVLAASFDFITHVISFGKYWHMQQQQQTPGHPGKQKSGRPREAGDPS
ncbi:MAG: glycosyltransferase family 2 protein [bacterium]|nr:glycosyltransferase family 2 protein [Candidatus Kapabacteria bacterium]